MRIHRALARAGVASRRKAEELVAAGRVSVNGAVARTGQVVDPSVDRIAVDGKELPPAATTFEWFVLNKPAGVVTTKSDPEGRRTVFELVPNAAGLTYVGRLDYLTEGVLLLTTDGDAAHVLTHPSSEVERTYVATVRGDVRAAVAAAREGVELDDGDSGNSRSRLAKGGIARCGGFARHSASRCSDSSVRDLGRSHSGSWQPVKPDPSLHENEWSCNICSAAR
jgi:23S rRNA pseudouridine2605 synthase